MTDQPASVARRLLVAVPELLEPTFARTVVFMVEHNPDGALGIVLNRPSDAPPDELREEWRSFVHEPAVVFIGGPVQLNEATIALGRVARVEPSDAWQPLLGRVGSVDLAEPREAHPHLEALRVFSGYAGWAPGQLDDELAHGGWHVFDADPGDLLTASPSTLWRDVMRRQGGAFAMAANRPTDSTVN
ncbi:MAG: YqgE/AlgH family protein [Acidimicrobiia bacterium]